MNDTSVKEIFSTIIGGPPPARFDVERAIRLGKRRRRARIAGFAAASLVVVGMVAVVVPMLSRGGGTIDGPVLASTSGPSSPTGFPYGGSAQVHPLPNSNYTPPADLVAVRLSDPAPGFPYRVQPDGLYAMTAGAGPACYGVEFVVSTAPTGADGSTATVFVTDCAQARATDGVIDGHAIVAHRPVAGVDGAFTRDTTGAPGSTSQNLVLYFTTGHFTTRIEGTALRQEQLLALGNALTGLPVSTPASGTIAGHLRQVGGPPPGVNRPVPGTVTISGGSTTKELQVGKDGSYTVDVPPGTYTVVGHSPTTLGGGSTQLPCPARGDAVVTSGASTTSDAICSIK